MSQRSWDRLDLIGCLASHVAAECGNIAVTSDLCECECVLLGGQRSNRLFVFLIPNSRGSKTEVWGPFRGPSRPSWGPMEGFQASAAEWRCCVFKYLMDVMRYSESQSEGSFKWIVHLSSDETNGVLSEVFLVLPRLGGLLGPRVRPPHVNNARCDFTETVFCKSVYTNDKQTRVNEIRIIICTATHSNGT